MHPDASSDSGSRRGASTAAIARIGTFTKSTHSLLLGESALALALDHDRLPDGAQRPRRPPAGRGADLGRRPYRRGTAVTAAGQHDMTVIHAALRAAVRTERLSRFSSAFLAHRAAKFGLAEPNAARPPLRNRRSEVRILSGAAT